MGQAPSTPELPEDWNAILPSLTREDIVQSFRTKCRIAEYDAAASGTDADREDGTGSYINGSTDKNKSDHSDKPEKAIYIHDELFDLDDYVPMALEILRAHPHLKDVRFKLVPGKMMEEHFWAGVFGILKDGGLGVEVEGMEAEDIGDDYQSGDEMIDGHVHLSPDANNECPRTSAQSPDDDVAGVQLWEHDTTEYIKSDNFVIREQGLLIASLQKSLREANHKIRKIGMELHKERKARAADAKNTSGDGDSEKHTGSTLTCPKCNTPQTSSAGQIHKGQWVMHPDCHEFLKLDDHLKENLRKEKEKRIKEVLSQMKFILDSDDLKDTYGKWSCCGKEEFCVTGCS
ncbi:hypothetical protein ACHAXS_007863 [Conticribra weissflogii]